jgi:hypothetical protein
MSGMKNHILTTVAAFAILLAAGGVQAQGVNGNLRDTGPAYAAPAVEYPGAATAGTPAAGLRKRPVSFAVKTNLLYGAGTMTPNLGLEFGVSGRGTVNIAGGYNSRNLEGAADDGANKKLVHNLFGIEYRYWLCERFNGHFFGVHTMGSRYNIGGYEIPLLLGEGSKNFRFDGFAVGAGLSYGCQFVLGTHWNLEAAVGVGYLYLRYDKYDCPKCGNKIGTSARDYLGPTNAGLSLMYLF